MTLSASALRGNPDDSIFIGIMPEDSVKELIAGLYTGIRATLQLPAIPRPKKNLHITLQPLPNLLRDIELARQACEAVSQRIAPFSVQLGEVMSFRNSEAFVLTRDQNPNRDITCFQRLLEAELFQQGVQIKKKSFTPHVTLAYQPNIVPLSVTPIGWTVDHFCIIHSHDGKSHYEIIDKWQLNGPVLPSALRAGPHPPPQAELALF